ncbi:MAG: hypothetical protein U0Y82_03885 [Thermoleophilia bacterium]
MAPDDPNAFTSTHWATTVATAAPASQRSGPSRHQPGVTTATAASTTTRNTMASGCDSVVSSSSTDAVQSRRCTTASRHDRATAKPSRKG